MPNWVTNNLEVRGYKKDIKKFKSDMENFAFDANKCEYYMKAIDFNKIVRIPSYIFRDNLGVEEKEKYGKNNWYDWSCENWGCKWNAHRAELAVDESDYLLYVFDTPWSDTRELMRILSVKYPDLEFSYSFAEEFQGNYVGKVSYDDGKIFDSEYPKDQSDRAFAIEEEICYPQYHEDYESVKEYHLVTPNPHYDSNGYYRIFVKKG